jgi:uncharacterized protein (DUF58 family)
MAVAGHAGAVPGAQLVDPRVLARIANLELLARTVVDGFINGLHKSPYFGASVDFAEHRGYVPGDDVRRIDWRVFARTDRFYVKEYEADSNANFAVVLDVSRSMRFASSGVSKLEYAKFVAACLTYMAHRQRDRVGLLTFDDAIVDYVPCSAKHFEVVLHALDRATPGRPGQLRPALRRAAEHLGRRGLVVVVSDFYEEPDDVIGALLPLRLRGHDLLVFHVLDPAEIEFTFEEPASFEDLETSERLPVVPEVLAARYRALVQDHVATIGRRCAEQRMDYALFDTSRPLDNALARFLTTRQILSRVR